ncbi:MerR family transcriptional regulator [Streptomyces sp. DT224]|uniref:MerR family transcriptional regulator n=1 Tax=Streptomyces sp. DT224 TaxID=3393426 RepID=UPI003CF721D7
MSGLVVRMPCTRSSAAAAPVPASGCCENSQAGQALRSYEKQGLLTPDRSAHGYQEYAEADVGAVTRIRALLAAGLPTATIRQGQPVPARRRPPEPRLQGSSRTPTRRAGTDRSVRRAAAGGP